MKWHRRLNSLLSPWPTANKKRSPRRVRLYLEELETRALLSASSVTAAATTPLSDVTAQANTLTASARQTSPPFSGYTPSQIQKAYGVPSTINGQTAGTGQTIAIVDAYNDPNIASDLAMFDTKYGLPAANFKVVDQNGNVINPKSTSVPSSASWGVEESLDVEWAHSIAPAANLVLVEANSNSLSNLMTAVNTAASMSGVSVVSMSWGSGEFSSETAYDGYFLPYNSTTNPHGYKNNTAVTFVASAGDNSANDGPVWPASSPNVLAVGGTTLSLTSSNTISSETAWSASYSRLTGWQGGGGGISSYETAPSFQSSNGVNYGGRSTPDVAWDANPSTGVSVYDSYHEPGWGYVGGTSAGAPAWAGIVAIADQNYGQPLSTTDVENALYGAYSAGGSAFNDITSGNNGYQATTGYDLATGLGSPKVSTLISSLFAAPSPASTTTTSTTSTTTSSTTGGTTQTSPQGTSNGPAHSHAILGSNETVNVPTSISITIVVISLPSAPTSVFPSFGSAGSTTSAPTTLSSAPLPLAQPSMSLAGNTPLFDGSLNGTGPQSAIVFGASGWNGSSLSWRLSRSGLSTPAMSELAGDSSEDEPEGGNNSSSEDGVRTIGVDVLLFDAAPPPLLDGQVSDNGEAAEGSSGSDGGDGGE